ncbi:hypothetical protein ER308_00680 [Egibacter rhizosphaerae]|uniref:DUF1440 domain-containing protein n=1 Tax=Egibacter rhizosphaerae TaxID=1670831 RepID=A0A411YAK3_9ACTN|nr:hypothetical protein [Egibacter rhizosphaerae]QBI18231.1 hypothetical protein ER308_00680 [Egibacter rhizosphaerae]
MDRMKLLGGVVGGLTGGVVFGVILQARGTIATVGNLVGNEGVGVGWLTLLIVTGVLGLVYAVTFGRLEHSWGRGALLGLAHGVIWWILGVLLIQPAITGGEFFVFGEAAWFNLLGYLIYGAITGLVTNAATQWAAEPVPSG